MNEQANQQVTGQVAPNTQNPQGNAHTQLIPVQQSSLQGLDSQQVLGSQNSRIIVPQTSASTPSGSQEASSQAQTGSGSWFVIVLAIAVLIGSYYYFVGRRRSRPRQAEPTETVIQPDPMSTNRQPVKKNMSRAKRKARRR